MPHSHAQRQRAGHAPHGTSQSSRKPLEHHCPREKTREALCRRRAVRRRFRDCLLGARFRSLSASLLRQDTCPRQMVQLFSMDRPTEIRLRPTTKRYGQEQFGYAPVGFETGHKPCRPGTLVGPAGQVRFATIPIVAQPNGMLAEIHNHDSGLTDAAGGKVGLPTHFCSRETCNIPLRTIPSQRIRKGGCH